MRGIMTDPDDPPITGEVQELTEHGWRTAHLGKSVPVRDRRRVVADREPTFPIGGAKFQDELIQDCHVCRASHARGRHVAPEASVVDRG